MANEIPWKGGILTGPKAVIVYEPLGEWRYAYWVKTQIVGEEPQVTRGTAEVVEVWENDEGKRKKEPPKHSITFGGATFTFPRRRANFFKEKMPFRVPSRTILEKWTTGEQKSRSSVDLWRLTENYIGLVLDLEDPFETKIVTLATFQTWLRRILDWAFNVDIGGPFGSGKSAALEAICEITFHGMLANPSAAATARDNETYDSSWFIDEYDKVKLGEESLIDTFIRQGYRRGLKIRRVNTDTMQTESFDPFGPKFLSYHTDIEQALKQRSITHLKMQISPDSRLPIINFAREVFSQPLFDEFFFWFMDNIASMTETQPDQPDQPDQGGGLGGISIRELLGTSFVKEAQKMGDSRPILDIFLSGEEPAGISISEGERKTPPTIESIELIRSNLRQRVFEIITSNLTEDERALLMDLKGRGAELGFLAISIARLLKIDIVKELREALTIKALEEEEPEFNVTEIVRDLLSGFHYEQGKGEINQAEVFTAARQQAKEYGQDISAKKFGAIIRDFGFRPSDPKKKVSGNIKRVGKRGVRVLVFDKRALKHIPPPEPDEDTDKTSGPTLKFCDFSLLFKLLEGDQDG
jgi:hypothetical protein